MRELSYSEACHVAGSVGWVVEAMRSAVVGLTTQGVIKAVWSGFGPVSSSTAGFGVVGPGAASATNPSSVDAVNGSDKQSDSAQS